ncbi:MAG: DEAD/DEAH box helicase family protein [Anaerolineae bacterium]|nr:DEAD/DEAH box helicase family protein [Anaerolineae bacterium]
MSLDKKSLSERDVCTKLITPAIKDVAGWDLTQFFEEFTLGKIHVRGKSVGRGVRDRADYILFYKKNLPLAIIEAKDNHHEIGAGMQQALRYAEMLDIPFAYSTNGDGFVEHDRTRAQGQLERTLGLNDFPSPQELWERYKVWKQIQPEEEKIITQPYFIGEKPPRYYQQVAINRTVEAIAKGQNRILLVMATGTGKTYTAFQIMYRLWKAKKKKRILFLADRNILVDQARLNDFKYFGDVMTKISDREVDKSFEVYLALYQAVSGTEEAMNVYKQFSPGFFDLIFVDECHRGSAAEDSAWRAILDYFAPATQIGLTATPKETSEISNIDYFGEPVYTYSLKQGIEDGFLAPYKVVRIEIDRDIDGWRPRAGQKDAYGYEIPDEVFYGPDFDKTLVIEERTQLVAHLVTEHLKASNRMHKTILFCRDIQHAEEMRRALINENGDLFSQNFKYIMRITGDSPDGKRELDNFIDPNEPYPVLVTTSKLLGTGVDTQTVQLIVLDSIINSMTEFKQMIGRGTRVLEKKNKLYFTIMDFRNATRLFRDKDFDGDPVQVYEPTPADPVTPPETETDDGESESGEENDGDETPRKYLVKDKVGVYVSSSQVQYLGVNGELVTESFTDYTRQNLVTRFPTVETFLTAWFNAERKAAIVAELLEQGVFLDKLQEDVGLDLDPFDLICHVAFDRKAQTRSERANHARQKPGYFEKYGPAARVVLEALVTKFADDGYATLDKVMDDGQFVSFLSSPPFDQIGRPLEVMRAFGGKDAFRAAMRELQEVIYES